VWKLSITLETEFCLDAVNEALARYGKPEIFNPDQGIFVISNRVQGLDRSMPHITSRGSNHLVGKRIVQTMAYMTPAEYESLQALNAWIKSSGCVIYRHVDEFNQSAGRKLGFRYEDGAEHQLLIGHRLLDRLIDRGSPLLHYDLRIHLDSKVRYEIKRERISTKNGPEGFPPDKTGY